MIIINYGFRPTGVYVNLLQNNHPYYGGILLNTENSWKNTLNDLSSEFNYSVSININLQHYETIISYEENKCIITYTFIPPKVSVSALIYWDDFNNLSRYQT